MVFFLCIAFFRFRPNSRKVKFVVSGMCPDSAFPVKFTDFQVSNNDNFHEPDNVDNDHQWAGCPPLSSLGQERFPIKAEEESAERQSDLHLHSEEAGAAGSSCRGQAAHLPEGLQQPALA